MKNSSSKTEQTNQNTKESTTDKIYKKKKRIQKNPTPKSKFKAKVMHLMKYSVSGITKKKKAKIR